MDVRTPGNAPARGSFASGLKVTTIVVVVGVLLALADHSLVSPRDGAHAIPDAPAATATSYAIGRLRRSGRAARAHRRNSRARRSVLTRRGRRRGRRGVRARSEGSDVDSIGECDATEGQTRVLRDRSADVGSTHAAGAQRSTSESDPQASMPPKQMYFTSTYSSMPYFEPSRPSPDCLTPPNGATCVVMRPVFTPTIPYSSCSATRQARPMSRRVEIRREPELGVVGERARLPRRP